MRACPVPPLTLLLASDQPYEAGLIDTEHMTPDAQQRLTRLRDTLTILGAHLTVTSAYRTPSYQQQFREVYTKYHNPWVKSDPDCSDIFDEVEAEADTHKLLRSKKVPARVDRAPHVKGIAFDATWVLPPGVDIDIIANACGWWRPYRDGDPMHFQLR